MLLKELAIQYKEDKNLRQLSLFRSKNVHRSPVKAPLYGCLTFAYNKFWIPLTKQFYWRHIEFRNTLTVI